MFSFLLGKYLSANTGLYDKCIFRFIGNWHCFTCPPAKYESSGCSIFLLALNIVSLFTCSIPGECNGTSFAHRFLYPPLGCDQGLVFSLLHLLAPGKVPTPGTALSTWNSMQEIFLEWTSSCLLEFSCFLKIYFCRGYWARRSYTLTVVKDIAKLLHPKMLNQFTLPPTWAIVNCFNFSASGTG